ncbi:hypothetical protein NL108_014469, partial [Boleophthalmus pectinirostris]
HAGEWTKVNKCTNITEMFCDLSHRIEEYTGIYKVRVQLEAGGAQSEWTHKKKINPTSTELQPPSFTMWATSSTLTIHIHQKPILRKLFLYGITYTIYLVETEQNKNTTAYLKDDIWDHQRKKEFSSLRWGKEYCITIKVEGNGGLASSLSHPQCVTLPDQGKTCCLLSPHVKHLWVYTNSHCYFTEWIITAIVALTIMGALIIVAFISSLILCYVKQPVKTPTAL